MLAAPKKNDLEPAFRQLKRGLMTGSDHAALSAYSTIYDAGSLAIPILSNELRKFDLKKPLRPEAIQLLSGLLALHRDLDEIGSDQFLDRHLVHSCPPVTAALLRSVGRISSQDYRKAEAGKIEIWEHKDLDEEYKASEFVRHWLAEIPDADLAGIRRVYVMPELVDNEWLGTYLPGLAVVTLAWWNVLPPRSRFNGILNLDHRFTLFHEIGHHVHQHSFGQDPEQEAEANEYARKAVYETSSTLGKTARAGIVIVRKILSALRQPNATRRS